MSDVFISYARADSEKARALAEVLAAHNWSVWWDRTIPPGRHFDSVIEEALDAARCVVVLWSKSSVQSTWVKSESADAMNRSVLVPVLIDDVKIPLLSSDVCKRRICRTRSLTSRRGKWQGCFRPSLRWCDLATAQLPAGRQRPPEGGQPAKARPKSRAVAVALGQRSPWWSAPPLMPYMASTPNGLSSRRNWPSRRLRKRSASPPRRRRPKNEIGSHRRIRQPENANVLLPRSGTGLLARRRQRSSAIESRAKPRQQKNAIGSPAKPRQWRNAIGSPAKPRNGIGPRAPHPRRPPGPRPRQPRRS